MAKNESSVNQSEAVESGGPEAVEVPTPRAKGALKAAMRKNTGGNTLGNVRGLPRRKVTFTISKDICAPGVFDDDFELTLVAPSSEDELRCARQTQGNASEFGMLLARNSLFAVNGEPVDHANLEHEWLWEALGNGGRNVVVGMFGQYCTADAASQGKALKSLRVES